ncbi:MAG TPA: hypothetical protein VLY04_24205 [Bryobacteraceae bacterium]|nr:hypothetical protein [Bryobacteraceae bacterium]
MRYWAYLAGKLVVAAAPLYGLLFWVQRAFPPPHYKDLARKDLGLVGLMFEESLKYEIALMVLFLLTVGVIYLIVWDQRRRCRVCLRRLRMPVETGSWSYMLQLGRPRIESICPYGHGTLSEEELQISGGQSSEWTPHSDDIWDELSATSKDSGQEP